MEIRDHKLSSSRITHELVFDEEFVQVSSTGEENSENSENLKHKRVSPSVESDHLDENSNYLDIHSYLNYFVPKPPKK